MYDSVTGYYNTNKLLSYQDATYFICLSGRGIGKTYGVKWNFLNRFIKRRELFACIFRTPGDLTTAMRSWTKAFTEPIVEGKKYYKPDDFKFRWVNTGAANLWFKYEDIWYEIGFFRTLTSVNQTKQETFPVKLCWVLFDEFIPADWTKLPGIDSEGDALLTILKTIDHDTYHSRKSRGLKPLKVILFANPQQWKSPMLVYFDIVPKPYGVYKIKHNVIVEYMAPLPISRNKNDLDESIHLCEAYLNYKDDIMAIPKGFGFKPVISLRYKNHFYTLYEGKYKKKNYKIWKFSKKKKHTPGCELYLGTNENLQKNEISLTLDTGDGTFKKMLKGWVDRHINYYADLNVKNTFYQDIVLGRR